MFIENWNTPIFPVALAWMGLDWDFGCDSRMLFAGHLLCLLLLPNLARHLLSHRSSHSRHHSSLTNLPSRLSGNLALLAVCNDVLCTCASSSYLS